MGERLDTLKKARERMVEERDAHAKVTCEACHIGAQYKDTPSRCVSCHMPRIMDALVFRARTHQIDDIPNAEMTQHFGQEDSPNACLLCHKEKSAEWVQQTMLGWKPASDRTKAAISSPGSISSLK